MNDEHVIAVSTSSCDSTNSCLDITNLTEEPDERNNLTTSA